MGMSNNISDCLSKIAEYRLISWSPQSCHLCIFKAFLFLSFFFRRCLETQQREAADKLEEARFVNNVFSIFIAVLVQYKRSVLVQLVHFCFQSVKPGPNENEGR